MSLKKKKQETPESRRLSATILAIFFFVLAILSVVIHKDQLLGNPTNFYDMYDGTTESIKKDTFIDIPIDAVIGNYAYTKHTTYFIPTGTDEHYLIWLDDEAFISLKVKDKSTINELAAMEDKTWEVLDSVDENGNYTKELPLPMHVKGTIHTIDYEIEGYMKEALNQIGATDYGYPVHYVEIDLTANQSSAWFQTIMCVAFCILGVVFFITENNAIKKQKAFAGASAAASASINTTMGDFSSDPIDEPYYGANPETNSYGYNQNDSDNPYGF